VAASGVWKGRLARAQGETQRTGSVRRGQQLIDSLSDRGGGSERKIRDFTEVVALTKNGETLVAEPIAENRQDTDQKFAEYRALFQGGHQAATNDSAERQEHQGEQNRQYGIGVSGGRL
jgi:hypothetical protein